MHGQKTSNVVDPQGFTPQLQLVHLCVHVGKVHMNLMTVTSADIHVYMYMCIHMCVYACMCIYIDTLCICIYIYTCYVYMYIQGIHIRVSISMCMYTCISAHIHS